MNPSCEAYPDSSSLSCARGGVEHGRLRASLTTVILWTLTSCALAFASPSPVDAPAAVLNSADQQSYQQAQKWMAEGRWEDASVALNGILRRNPGGLLTLPSVGLDLIRAMAHLGRREEAVSLLDQALGREKKAARRAQLLSRIRIVSRMFLSNATFQFYQDGINLLDAAKYRAAREKFEKALEKEPDNVEILVRLGQCLLMEGDEDSAAERLRLARKLNPFEPEIRLWLGRALQKRGELKQAIEDLRTASNELPGSELAALWYSEALFASGKRSAAIQQLEGALERSPMHLEGLVALARLKVDAALAGESRREEALWSARRDLQLVVSRLSAYKPGNPETKTGGEGDLDEGGEDAGLARHQPMVGSELSFTPRRSASALLEEVKLLQQRVEKALSAGSSA